MSEQEQQANISLFNTIEDGDFEKAKLLLANGSDVRAKYNTNINALHLLALSKSNEEDIIELATILLEHGADINASDEFLTTPLLIASMLNKTKFVIFLLENAADVNLTHNSHISLLQLQTHNNKNVEIIKLLIEQGANVNLRFRGFDTALNEVLSWDDETLEIVELLLAHGAHSNDAACFKNSPLHISASTGKLESVKLLLKYDANHMFRNDQNQTPSDIAYEHKYSEIALIIDQSIKDRILNNITYPEIEDSSYEKCIALIDKPWLGRELSSIEESILSYQDNYLNYEF